MEATLTKKDGTVSMDRPFAYLCSLLRNGVYTVKITRKTKARTLPQNALMWMWFQCLADYSGQPKEDWRDYYALKFLGREVTVGRETIRVPGHTSKLDSQRMTEFLNQVQADAATEHGVTLPLPGDRFFSDFADEYLKRI